MTEKFPPTADHVAMAVVAACRETGEDPFAVMQRVTQLRARHYALHALREVCDIEGARAADLVGCPAKPHYFFANSRSQVFYWNSIKGHRAAKWWREDAFERIVSAIRAVPAPALESAPEAPARSPRVDIEDGKEVFRGSADKPVKLTADIGSIIEPTRPSATPGKIAARNMLAEAMAETARQQARMKSQD